MWRRLRGFRLDAICRSISCLLRSPRRVCQPQSQRRANVGTAPALASCCGRGAPSCLALGIPRQPAKALRPNGLLNVAFQLILQRREAVAHLHHGHNQGLSREYLGWQSVGAVLLFGWAQPCQPTSQVLPCASTHEPGAPAAAAAAPRTGQSPRRRTTCRQVAQQHERPIRRPAARADGERRRVGGE